MTKREQNEYQDRQTLSRAGWGVTKASRYNSGRETVVHSVAKQLAGHYLKHECGYRVVLECNHDDRGEIDVLAYGQPDRINPLAVELETSPTAETIEHKLENYVDGTPIQECYVLNINEMPARIMEAYGWIHDQL